MEYKIHGTVMQALEVTLAQGESIYTESGGMAWMTRRDRDEDQRQRRNRKSDRAACCPAKACS